MIFASKKELPAFIIQNLHLDNVPVFLESQKLQSDGKQPLRVCNELALFMNSFIRWSSLQILDGLSHKGKSA